jgi:hypothetical protein
MPQLHETQLTGEFSLVSEPLPEKEIWTSDPSAPNYSDQAVGPCLLRLPLIPATEAVGTSERRLRLVVRVGLVLSWGAACMQETASRQNNFVSALPLSRRRSNRWRWEAGGLVVSPVSRSGEICVWWSAFGTLTGDGLVGCCSCVCRLAVGCVDDGR